MTLEYLRTKERYRERRLATNSARRKENREYIIRLKESNPCTDCGNFYPYYVMEFDHRENKSYNIGELLTSTNLLFEELKKCDIVCANCHSIRTHTRRQNNPSIV